MTAKITDEEIERVCHDLRVAPAPLLSAGALNRAREEAIRLIKDLREALHVLEKHAQNIEHTARVELERCLPGYAWPHTLITEVDMVSPRVDPFTKFQAAAEAREAEVTALFDETDHRLVETQRILAPGIVTMKELESRLSGTDGVKFSYGVAGHQASVTLNTSVSHHRLTLETNNSLRIIIDEYQSFSFDSSGSSEKKSSFASVDEAVTYIAEACGRHVGERAALEKRSPST